MKKIIALCTVFVLGVGSMSAQETQKKCCETKCSSHIGVFNHLGGNINVGTQGIGLDLAVPITKYLELSVGLNTMPAFKYDFDINVGNLTAGQYVFDGGSVNVKANMERTTGEAKLSIYPFGCKNDLFVVGGISYGGNRLAKITAYSDQIERFYSGAEMSDINGNPIPTAARPEVESQIDKYEVQFDHDGRAQGEIKVRNWRPYMGLGYGRLIPKKKVGFRVEAGVQIMGKMAIYQDGVKVNTKELNNGADDDFSKVADKIKVYPVLKFALTGKFI